MTEDRTQADPLPESPTAAPPPPAFDRTISPIAGRWGGGRGGKIMVVAALVAGCGVFVLATRGPDRSDAPPDATGPARQVVPFEPIDPNALPTLAAPGADAPVLDPTGGPAVPPLDPNAPPPAGAPGPSPAEAAAARRAELAAIRSAPILAFNRSSGVAAPVLPPTLPAGSDVGEPTALDRLRQTSGIDLGQAGRLGNRNFLILAGTSIPCVLQTAMDTATPGYVSCVVPNDVYSDNGAVVLLDKGTRVLGEYRAGLRQGQRRLFVLWSRAVTPAGVAIQLASPASDPLGRAGFDGQIDTHFWDRFGGALLLSIVDDGAYAVAGDRQSSSPRLPSDAAGSALQGSIDIPPSLRKAQGAEVSIFVAQDFDFSGVYGLRAR